MLKRKLKQCSSAVDVEREIQIMHHLAAHPNIVPIRGVYEDWDNIHVVMDLCTGGQLLDKVVARGHYTEKDAAEVIQTVIKVVAHCHDMGVIHRDLKPENFLYADNGKHGQLMAIDFGLSIFFKEGEVFHRSVGTPFYMAPEVLHRHYGKEADMWSCGIILYILLSGVPPFYGESVWQIQDAILHEDLDLDSDPWPRISSDAKDIVKRLLHRCPMERASAKEILSHKWMKETGNGCGEPLTNPVLGRLREFATMNKLKKDARRIIAMHMPKEEIEGMRQMFCQLDSDCNGTVTFDELRQGLKKKGASIPEAELHHLMNDINLDGDGVLHYEDFLAATVCLSNLHNGARLMAAFEHFDTDGCGYITRDHLFEAIDQCGNVDQNIDQILSEVDRDHDGRIDYKDFCRMMVGGQED